MRSNAFTLLLAAGMAIAAPASPAEVARSVDILSSPASYTGAEIVARMASVASLNPRATPAQQDPNVCYSECVLDGGGDWECICDCVDCGGRTSAPKQ
ncbi:hypothetical protein MCOR25_010288 [Pyricularia grisea]|uniref:Uncharacterized protein n=1 Tax=Pyricularia grisea TaxID=148305 RepID=A0A6P8BA84_PYRGI|nr:uncharacterized protein PgNI_03550 [Pyricularia grisea]KAI6350918.1 hypothetical protein MCOR25_010288 [Pyricularia grisea]TLD12736.1 hypothetical protein PgNI_03550 [Pyricularia grisea]